MELFESHIWPKQGLLLLWRDDIKIISNSLPILILIFKLYFVNSAIYNAKHCKTVFLVNYIYTAADDLMFVLETQKKLHKNGVSWSVCMVSLLNGTQSM
jgi:hypothetical protein